VNTFVAIITDRHDSIVRLLVLLCHRAGLIAHAEPPMRDAAGHRLRPDIMLRTHNGDVYAEVSVCSTWAPSNASPRALLNREASKRSNMRG
jgi:hypothetical protein